MELHIATGMLECPEEELACRILERAVEDYKLLKDANVSKMIHKSEMIRIIEVESFFNSDWCEELLEMIKSELSGSDILKYINDMYA